MKFYFVLVVDRGVRIPKYCGPHHSVDSDPHISAGDVLYCSRL